MHMGAIMNTVRMMASPFITMAGGTCCTPSAIEYQTGDNHDFHIGRDQHEQKGSQTQQSQTKNKIQRVDPGDTHVSFLLPYSRLLRRKGRSPPLR